MPDTQTSFITELLKLLGEERCSTATTVREQHGKDESFHPPMPPEVVVFPRTDKEVSNIVKIALNHQKPIIPFGAGSSLEGHVLAVKGGICIDFTQMNKILEINENDLDCRVQTGVTKDQLNQHLETKSLFFSVDPGANATIGGMTATRASGTNTVRYGTIRENVLGLTVVLPDGKIIKTGGRVKKSASGYDLTHLFCGSEGTLGIITEVQLRLYGIPEYISAAVCSFPSLHDAINAVIPVIQSGIPIAKIELLDDVMIQAVNNFSQLNYPEKNTLFFEFHGTKNSTEENIHSVKAMMQAHGGTHFNFANNREDRKKLWKARHDALYAALAQRPGAKSIVTDVCVPVSRLPECILETKKDIKRIGVFAPIAGHVGDGNFHLNLIVYPEKKEEAQKAIEVSDRLVGRALKMGGSCSGEHGIGYGKVKYMRAEHREGIDVMQAIKTALDPMNIMNPAKVLP